MSRPTPLVAPWPAPMKISVLGAAAMYSMLPRSSASPAATVIPASIRLSRCAPSEVPLAMTSLTTRARATNPAAKLNQPQPEKPVDARTYGHSRPPYVEIHNDHQGRKKAAIRPAVAMVKNATPARSAVTSYSDAHRRTRRRGVGRIRLPATSTGWTWRPCRSLPSRYRQESVGNGPERRR